MNKNKVDILLHSVVAAAMTLALLLLPHAASVALSVNLFWYGWELSQRIVKDEENRGFLYWWNVNRWGDQAVLEFMVPSLVATTVTAIVYLIITL